MWTDGLLRFARNDGIGYLRKNPRSRGMICPSFAFVSPSPRRGRRESRVHAAPAVSCARVERKPHTSIQVQRRHSGFPCAMALRLIRALPGETRLCCHRLRKDACAHFTMGHQPLGRPNHTISPYASCAFVSYAFRVHRIPPRVRDVRNAPLIGRDASIKRLSWGPRQGKLLEIRNYFL